ncbi:MAG: hypothetical protein ACO2ZP_00490 [Bacteriovoracaceae bacterium]
MRILFIVIMILSVSCGKDDAPTVNQCTQKSLFGPVWFNEAEDVAFLVQDEELGAAIQLSDTNIGCTWLGFPLIVGDQNNGVIDILNATDSGELGCSLVTENIVYSIKCSTLTLCDSSGCADYTEL